MRHSKPAGCAVGDADFFQRELKPPKGGGQRDVVFRTLRDAHREAGQRGDAHGMKIRGDQKPLPVVKRDRAEEDMHPFATERPGQPARHDVDVISAQEEIQRGDGLVPNPIGRPDNRRRHGAAHVDIEAGIVAFAVHLSEAGDSREDTAHEKAALADTRHARCRGNDEERRDRPPHGESAGVYNVWRSVREQCQQDRTQSSG